LQQRQASQQQQQQQRADPELYSPVPPMAARGPEGGILVHGFAPDERAFALDCLMTHGLDIPPDPLMQNGPLLAAAHMFRFVKKVGDDEVTLLPGVNGSAAFFFRTGMMD
jgi:hypothetical protein